MNRRQELADSHAAKNREADALLEKMSQEGATAEGIAEVETLNKECKDLEAEIEQLGEQEKRLAALRGETQRAAAFERTPVRMAFSGARSPGTPGNGVNVLGLVADGEMVIDPHRKGGLADILNLNLKGQPDIAFPQAAFEAVRKPEYEQAYLRYIAKGLHQLTHTEQAVLQEGLDTAGGYLSPEQILNRLLEKKPTPTRVAGRTTQINTSRDAITMPIVRYTTDDIYTTGIRATWTGEIPASSGVHRTTDPVFGQVRIPIYTAMLSLLITNDLLEDSTVDLMAYLSRKFGETVDLLRDNMVINGTGINQPMGILANPGGTDQPAVVNSGNASEVTGDGLIDLTESLPEQYDEDAVLVFNKTNTGKAIRKLKDGDGRPLVSYGAGDFGLAGGRYREINGYPYIWSGFMPNVAANTYPAIFGDLNGYFLANRIGFSVQVLNEVYAEVNGKLLLGRVRFGGVTAEPWRLRILKIAA